MQIIIDSMVPSEWPSWFLKALGDTARNHVKEELNSHSGRLASIEAQLVDNETDLNRYKGSVREAFDDIRNDRLTPLENKVRALQESQGPVEVKLSCDTSAFTEAIGKALRSVEEAKAAPEAPFEGRVKVHSDAYGCSSGKDFVRIERSVAKDGIGFIGTQDAEGGASGVFFSPAKLLEIASHITRLAHHLQAQSASGVTQ